MADAAAANATCAAAYAEAKAAVALPAGLAPAAAEAAAAKDVAIKTILHTAWVNALNAGDADAASAAEAKYRAAFGKAPLP